VIRIESENRPDVQRASWPFKDNIPGVNRAGYFANFNSNKYGITLNFKHPRGVEIAKQLIARADVVTESFTAGVMEKWTLGYNDLKKIKPDIIMISMAMMGQTGPYRTYRGHGMQLAAAAGVGNLIGWPDRDPVGSPTAYTDYFVPHFAAVAVMTALDYRRRTGHGQYIDLSQFESAIHALDTAILDYTVNSREQMRNGNRLTNIPAAPHGAYKCRGDDDWCAIAVFTDEEWQSFCRVIGNPPWTRDQKFSTQSARVKNADELDKLVEEWTGKHSSEEVMNLMQAAGVAAGVVKNNKSIHEDPQLKHRNHYWVLDHPEMGKCTYDGPSFKLSKTPAQLTMPGPCLGQHNHYVYTHILGMSDEEFVQLMEEGAFY
jgi:crotonobetainyl-CoA:carnitine CoA-transferase CaiB-like acyl-CoA transferase